MRRGSQEASVALLWHTARHLRARQLLAQLWRRSGARLGDPQRLARRERPRYPGCAWHLAHRPLAPGRQRNDAQRLLGGRFEFINEPVDAGWPPDWRCDDQSLLWRYNLHYFEWLWALDFDDARHAVDSWIAHHPPGRRAVGWAPYPLSLRLQNWLALFFGRWRERTERERPWAERLWSSVWVQAEWLARNLEYHLMGNHLLENAVALTWAGACFAGDDAGRWFRTGLRLLRRELDEQILPDGMHYERSPMYHLRAAYALLLLSCVERRELAPLLCPVLERMSRATGMLMHPDAGIALLNDSAFGIANEPTELLAAAAERQAGCAALPHGAWSLPAGGYYGYRDGGTYLICDAAPIGPDHMTGHAHGDLLSFELSAGGRRMLVDSGVSSYAAGEPRSFSRSTRAHNTVEIEGQDQCEFWGVFRVGRRGRPFDVDWCGDDDGFALGASHDGYRRLPGAPVHRRLVSYDRRRRVLEVIDRVEASRPVRAVARLHLHPACELGQRQDDSAEIVRDDQLLRLVYDGSPGAIEREPSWYMPEFGRRIPRICLARTAHGSSIDLRLRIELAGRSGG
ncbi:MAG TPA: alginate lyase family protein [Candidatus Polarisedimenticolaceae bacterium]|nr:alginate lyase family protein [Candidatus Polarisedimenticolaceae bacterium]